MTLRSQVLDELDRAITVPVGALLGLDLADMTRQRIRDRASTITAALTSGSGDDNCAGLVQDLMCLLWPVAPEHCGQAGWWRSPLGQACARSLGHDAGESVSQSVAAVMLGVTRGTVAQLVHRGTLDRHPDGGVLRASVLRRLAR